MAKAKTQLPRQFGTLDEPLGNLMIAKRYDGAERRHVDVLWNNKASIGTFNYETSYHVVPWFLNLPNLMRRPFNTLEAAVCIPDIAKALVLLSDSLSEIRFERIAEVLASPPNLGSPSKLSLGQSLAHFNRVRETLVAPTLNTPEGAWTYAPCGDMVELRPGAKEFVPNGTFKIVALSRTTRKKIALFRSALDGGHRGQKTGFGTLGKLWASGLQAARMVSMDPTICGALYRAVITTAASADQIASALTSVKTEPWQTPQQQLTRATFALSQFRSCMHYVEQGKDLREVIAMTPGRRHEYRESLKSPAEPWEEKLIHSPREEPQPKSGARPKPNRTTDPRQMGLF